MRTFIHGYVKETACAFLFSCLQMEFHVVNILWLIAGWVDVEWDSDTKNSYRYGKDSAYDVKVRQTKYPFLDLEHTET